MSWDFRSVLSKNNTLELVRTLREFMENDLSLTSINTSISLERQKFYGCFEDILGTFFRCFRENTNKEVFFTSHNKEIGIKGHNYIKEPVTPLSAVLGLLSYCNAINLLDLLSNVNHTHMVKYPFPFESLPIPTQMKFKKMAIPGILYTDILTNPVKKYLDPVSLTIFEYYVFQFLLYPSQPDRNPKIAVPKYSTLSPVLVSSLGNLCNTPYTALCLTYFSAYIHNANSLAHFWIYSILEFWFHQNVHSGKLEDLFNSHMMMEMYIPANVEQLIGMTTFITYILTLEGTTASYLKIIAPDLMQYLALALTRFPIETDSHFNRVLDVWLSFLLPWNAKDRLRGSNNYGKSKGPIANVVSDQQRPYIEEYYAVAHYSTMRPFFSRQFYVHLLLLFLRRIEKEVFNNKPLPLLTPLISLLSTVFTPKLTSVLEQTYIKLSTMKEQTRIENPFLAPSIPNDLIPLFKCRELLPGILTRLNLGDSYLPTFLPHRLSHPIVVSLSAAFHLDLSNASSSSTAAPASKLTFRARFIEPSNPQLTEEQRRDILNGRAMRRNLSIEYNGSSLYLPLSQYECLWIVRFLIFVSESVNSVTVPLKENWGVNLRPLGDYRNWVLALLVYTAFCVLRYLILQLF